MARCHQQGSAPNARPKIHPIASCSFENIPCPGVPDRTEKSARDGMASLLHKVGKAQAKAGLGCGRARLLQESLQALLPALGTLLAAGISRRSWRLGSRYIGQWRRCYCSSCGRGAGCLCCSWSSCHSGAVVDTGADGRDWSWTTPGYFWCRRDGDVCVACTHGALDALPAAWVASR